MNTSLANERQDAELALREVALHKPRLVVDSRPGGISYLRQKGELGTHPERATERLAHYACTDPTRLYLSARTAEGVWLSLTYGQAFERICRIAQAFLDIGLGPAKPLAILSENSIDHALLGLAALHVGIPYAPISTAYSLVSKDFSQLRDILGLLKPGVVFSESGTVYRDAITAAVSGDTTVCVSRDPLDQSTTLVANLLYTTVTDQVSSHHEGVSAKTIAKYLFTSGTTGKPKGVINTHGMLMSNQEMIRDCFRFFEHEPPILLDWAPWNHTGGGNMIFGMAAYNGGSFWIDDGRPTPAFIDRTVRNIRDVRPTWYWNVPKGFDELVPQLERDADLREKFFSRLKIVFYASAGLAQHTYDAIRRMAAETTGERILFVTGLGATETGPFATVNTSDTPLVGNIGIPGKGVTLKLVPIDGKLDARIKSPSVMPGYLQDEDTTRNAFDDEGFYRLGDALRFADPERPESGLFFDGRTAENFKLESGTWVNVGALRARVVNHFGSAVHDVVLTGLNKKFVGALIVPNIAVCRDVAGLPGHAADAEVLSHEKLRQYLSERLDKLFDENAGSSRNVERIILVETPLSIDKGELTDKGSINQRAVLTNRQYLVDELYEGSPSVIIRAEENPRAS